MLEDSEFKPHSLNDLTVSETIPEEPESVSATQGVTHDEVEVVETKISDRLSSFKPLIINEQGNTLGFEADVATGLADKRTEAEKIRLSKNFRTSNFFQENSLLTNAENFAENIIDGANLYKTELLTKIEEKANDTERIHQNTITKNLAAKEEREKLLSEAEKKVVEIKKSSFNEGFEAGRLEGIQKRYDEAEQLVFQVNSVLTQLSNLRQAVRFQAEKELVHLALQISKKVVAEEIKLSNDVIKNIVQAALNETDIQGKIFLYLHPDDYEFLLNSKADLERHLNNEQSLVLRQDPKMNPGSIYVESDEEVISRSIEDQFEKLEDSLTEQIKNRHAHLSEVDMDNHNFSIRTTSEDDECVGAAAVHLQENGEGDMPAETQKGTKLKTSDPEENSENNIDQITQKTVQSDSSKADKNKVIEIEPGSVDLSEKEGNFLPNNSNRPPFEVESNETVKQKNILEDDVKKVTEQETISINSIENLSKTDTEDDPEQDKPK